MSSPPSTTLPSDALDAITNMIREQNKAHAEMFKQLELQNDAKQQSIAEFKSFACDFLNVSSKQMSESVAKHEKVTERRMQDLKSELACESRKAHEEMSLEIKNMKEQCAETVYKRVWEEMRILASRRSLPLAADPAVRKPVVKVEIMDSAGDDIAGSGEVDPPATARSKTNDEAEAATNYDDVDYYVDLEEDSCVIDADAAIDKEAQLGNQREPDEPVNAESVVVPMTQAESTSAPLETLASDTIKRPPAKRLPSQLDEGLDRRPPKRSKPWQPYRKARGGAWYQRRNWYRK